MCYVYVHVPLTTHPGDTLDGPQIQRGKSKVLPLTLKPRPACPAQSLLLQSSASLFPQAQPRTALLFFQDHVHPPQAFDQAVLCVRNIPLLLSCSLIHPLAVGLPPQGSFPSAHRLIRCFVTNLVDSSLLPCEVLVSVCKLTFITVII